MNQSLSVDFSGVVPAVIEAGLPVSLCTIQIPDGGFVDAGQPSGYYLPVAGLVNLICMSAPMSDARIQATEEKQLEDIQSFAPRHVWLAGYYPTIQDYATQGAQAVIDGVVYDLLGSESDSQMRTTRLAVRTSGL